MSAYNYPHSEMGADVSYVCMIFYANENYHLKNVVKLTCWHKSSILKEERHGVHILIFRMEGSSDEGRYTDHHLRQAGQPDKISRTYAHMAEGQTAQDL